MDNVFYTDIKISGIQLKITWEYSDEEEELFIYAKLNHTIVGKLKFFKDYDVSSLRKLKVYQYIYLESLSVHSAYRYNGIANHLMNIGLNLLPEYYPDDTYCFLIANPMDNMRGLDLETLVLFYKKYGFRIIDETYNSRDMVLEL